MKLMKLASQGPSKAQGGDLAVGTWSHVLQIERLCPPHTKVKVMVLVDEAFGWLWGHEWD